MDVQALLNEFPGYLEANRLAPARHIPFLLRWVERYLAAPYDPALRPDDRLLAFLDKLARNAAIAEWQVHQAEDAVCLFRQFAGTRQAAGANAAVAGQRPTAAAPGAAGPPAPAPLALSAEWQAALGRDDEDPGTAQLLAANGTDLHGMDAAVRPVLPDAAPGGTGRRRRQALSDLPGHAQTGVGLDPEPGVQRAALPLPGCPGAAAGGLAGHGEGQARAQAAGGLQPG